MALWQWTGRAFEQRTLRRDNAGADFLLCCPGPSLSDVRDADLHVPGAVVVAVNTAYPQVRPDVWVGLDPPECYAGDLLWRPWPKVFGSRYSENVFYGRAVKECQGVYFLQGHDGKWARPAEMFDRLADQPEFCWCGNTFHAALHVCLWMGARRIYLVGCDFGGPSDYHDGRELTGSQRDTNRWLMAEQVLSLPMLRLRAQQAGIELLSATEGSAANEHLEYVPLDEALRRIAAGVPDTSGHVRIHSYKAEHALWQTSGKRQPRGVVTGADEKTEWVLGWWFANLRRANRDLPIAFADFGLSDAGRKWCRQRGDLLTFPCCRLEGWFRKPTAILHAPFDEILWLDSDCQVRGDVSRAFDAVGDKGFAASLDRLNPWCRSKRPVNTGVVAVRHGEKLIEEWASEIIEHPGRHRGDQEALSWVADADDPRVAVLADDFQWLRLCGREPADETVLHWTGPAGKEAIRRMVQEIPTGHRADELARRLAERFGSRPIRGAEVGVLAGKTSARLLAALPNLETLFMVDAWFGFAADSRYALSADEAAGQTTAQMVACLRQAVEGTQFAAERRTILRGLSVEMAERVADASLDFVFIDADHSEAGCRSDVDAWWPKLRPGGLLCGHDWDNPEGPDWGVRRAVDAFRRENAIDAEMDFGADFTWFFHKPAEEAGGPRRAVGVAERNQQ